MIMQTNLISRIWPEAQSLMSAKLVLAAAGVALLTASSHLMVPFWPVPLTMQTFVVLMIGASYGARLGAATLATWLVLGIAGLPVFASGAGPLYMMGPTGGYLVGDLVAAFAVGWLIERGFGRTLLGTAAVLVVGDIALFILGVSWLAHLIGFEKAIVGGLIPFILGEAVKLALATATLKKLAR